MLNELEIIAETIKVINAANFDAMKANVPFELRRVLLHAIHYLESQIKDYLQS
jgi:hypothetical protein